MMHRLTLPCSEINVINGGRPRLMNDFTLHQLVIEEALRSYFSNIIFPDLFSYLVRVISLNVFVRLGFF